MVADVERSQMAFYQASAVQLCCHVELPVSICRQAQTLVRFDLSGLKLSV